MSHRIFPFVLQLKIVTKINKGNLVRSCPQMFNLAEEIREDKEQQDLQAGGMNEFSWPREEAKRGKQHSWLGCSQEVCSMPGNDIIPVH